MSVKDDDIVEQEAGEDEEEERKEGPKRGRKKPVFEDSSEEDEDDEDGQDEFEKDGFIVDEDEDEEADEGADDNHRHGDEAGRADTVRKKKKRHRRHRDYEDDSDELAEGDLELLEEHGHAFKRSRKRHRLKKATGGDDDEEDDNFRSQLELLGDDEQADDFDDELDGREAVDEDVDDFDEFDDFIDDGGRGRRGRKKEKSGAISSDAVRAARSVFGDYEDIADVYQTTSVKKSGARKSQFHEDENIERSDDVSDSDQDDEHEKLVKARTLTHKRSGSRQEEVDENDDTHDPDVDSGDSEDDQSLRQTSKHRRARTSTAPMRGLDEDVEDITSAAETRLTFGTTVRLSAEDKLVVATDVPERLQLHFGARVDVSAEELRSESTWIYARSFALDPAFTSTFSSENVVKKIEIVLNYLHTEKHDIPFIAQYRKDYIGPELLFPCGGNSAQGRTEHRPSSAYQGSAQLTYPKGFNSVDYDDFESTFSIDYMRGVEPGYDDGFGDWSALWTVFDWDKKWAEFSSHRTTVIDLISRSSEQGVAGSVIEQARDWAEACEDDVQLSDVEREIRLALEAASAARTRRALEDNDLDALSKNENASGRRKRPNSRLNRYLQLCRKGCQELSAKFGITASQFADNLNGALQYGESYQLHVPRDEDIEPVELARLVGHSLADFAATVAESAAASGLSAGDDLEIDSDPSSLLDSARYILAQEILVEPRVVQAARRILRLDTTMVTATVTQSGMLAVDESHPLRAAVTVKDKPIRAFYNSTDFAKMKKAETKGYTQISFRFQPEYEQALRRHLVAAATVSMTTNSPLIEKWNAERHILVDSVCDCLTARLLSEAEELLAKRTDETLMKRLTNAASRRLLQGPARPFAGEDGAPRVMAICVTNEEDEDPDPAQEMRNAEEAKTAPGSRPYQRPKGARVTFVNLDSNGEFISSEEVFGFWLRRPLSVRTPPQEISKRLQTYLAKNKPQMIVTGLGSGGKDAVRLREDIIEVVTDMVFRKTAAFLVGDEISEHAALWEEEKRHDLVGQHVISIPEDVARMYCETNAVNVALPVDCMTLVEKRAIALGRIAQEPLSVFAGIAAEDDVAAKLEFHRLHFMTDRQARIEAFRRALTRAVCTNGVDVNRLLVVPHMQPMLNFVGGLGRCKAAALIRKFEQTLVDDSGPLMSRKHLFANNFMGRVVFVSAAGFLRVRDPALHHGGSTVEAVKERRRRLERRGRGRSRDDDSQALFFDPLDDSRIHPENYAVALKIADEALRDENGDLRVNLSGAGNVSEASRIIAAVLDNPEGLSQLDLEKYADHLEKLDRGRLYETIKMVASEFQAPFKDYRVPARTPAARAEFFLAIGADPLELHVGTVVTATNCQVTRKLSGISCRLPYGLRGYITRTDFSDEMMSGDEMKRLVSEGSDIQCRILGFQYKAFEVKLTSRPSLLADPRQIPDYALSYDPHNEYVLEYPSRQKPLSLSANDTAVSRYGVSAGAPNEAQRRGRETALGPSRPKEVTCHDFYRDVSSEVATELLRNAAPGEVVIRPSRKGDDQYVFTARFADTAELSGDSRRGIIHVMCYIQQPVGKEGTAKYMVGEEPYTSVDEILERFIIPVVSNMGEALQHRKFMSLHEDELEKHVSAMKKQFPASIPYFFGLADNKPLYLYLYYVPGSKTAHKEPIKVVPDGYQFRGVLHTTLDLLTSWFKKNMRKNSAAVSSRAPAGISSPFIASSNVPSGRAVINNAPVPPSPFIATPVADDAPPQMPSEPFAISQYATSASAIANQTYVASSRPFIGASAAPTSGGPLDGVKPNVPPPRPPSPRPDIGMGTARQIPSSPPPAQLGRIQERDTSSNGISMASYHREDQNRPYWGGNFNDRSRPAFNTSGQGLDNMGQRGPPWPPNNGPMNRSSYDHPQAPAGALNDAAARRGQMPIPAWKKAQQETQQ